MSGSRELTERLKQEARRLGFGLAGVCPAVSPPGTQRFEAWLAAGYAGEMHYLADRREAYSHPRHVLDGASSIVILAMSYRNEEPRPPAAGEGRVARYAWGVDYHDLVRDRLRQLIEFVHREAPEAQARGVVDTAPLLEREFAQIAGLGWIGKNTLLLNRQMGSWFVLAALLTDLALEPDLPHETDHCGTCRACLDACPTGAFVDAYQLDARRCISYLTIELRSAIPRELREGVGDWLFGCDVCQDVCPWNRKSPEGDEADFQPQPGSNPVELAPLFYLSDDEFRTRYRHSPLWRPKRRGLLRNAAIVLGNQARQGSLPPAATAALLRGLSDAEPLVRGACAWALGQANTCDAQAALHDQLAIESDAEVRNEIRQSLEAVTRLSG